MLIRQAWVSGIFAATALLVAGCGGGGSASPAPAATSQSNLVASPASITNVGRGTQVLVTGVQGAATITVANQFLLDVSTPVVNGSAIAFTLTEIAGGNTTVTVTDATHASVTIPVTMTLCVPPTPNVTLVGENVAIATPSPAPGQPQQGATFTYVYFGVPIVPAPYTAPATLPYRTRLVGSDRSIVNGTGLTAIGLQGNPQPPPPPASPPPGQSVYFDTLPPLLGGLPYQIQLADSNGSCAPPFVVGSFST
jgi:hypothetical protein